MPEDEVPPDAKAEVVAAVGDALAEHGYERLTTAKIAEAYPKSEAGLYYYYDSKDEMIAAFLETTSDHLALALADADLDGPRAELEFACERLFLSPGDEDADLHVAIMELLSHAPHNETIHGPLVQLSRDTHAELERILDDGVEAGVFRNINPGEVAWFLLSAADGSTGVHVALELDVGREIRSGLETFVDWLQVPE